APMKIGGIAGGVLFSEVSPEFTHASVLIWTTTPWTLPGNRAISYSPKIAYGIYEVTDAPDGNWAKPGDKLILAHTLAADVFDQARVTSFKRLLDVPASGLASVVCEHPLR